MFQLNKSISFLENIITFMYFIKILNVNELSECTQEYLKLRTYNHVNVLTILKLRAYYSVFVYSTLEILNTIL